MCRRWNEEEELEGKEREGTEWKGEASRASGRVSVYVYRQVSAVPGHPGAFVSTRTGPLGITRCYIGKEDP